jgi:hypothetical protein
VTRNRRTDEGQTKRYLLSGLGCRSVASGFYLFDVGHTVEDLDDHSKIAFRAEVRDFDAAELAGEDQIVSSFGLRRQRLVEFRSSDSDVGARLRPFLQGTADKCSRRRAARSECLLRQ